MNAAVKRPRKPTPTIISNNPGGRRGKIGNGSSNDALTLKIIAARKRGATHRAIASAYCISQQTVYWHIKKHERMVKA